MKSKYIIILPLLLPIIAILIQCVIINNIDKELTYETIDIKHQDISQQRTDVGLRMSYGRWGIRVFFYDQNDNFYERRYRGFIQRILAKSYYSQFVENTPIQINCYIDEDEKSNLDKIPFFHFEKPKEKSVLYYWDIYNFVKEKYYISFIIIYLGCVILLFFLNERFKACSSIYYKILTVDLILFVMYLLL